MTHKLYVSEDGSFIVMEDSILNVVAKDRKTPKHVGYPDPDSCRICETKKGQIKKGLKVENVFYHVDGPRTRYMICNFCSSLFRAIWNTNRLEYIGDLNKNKLSN